MVWSDNDTAWSSDQESLQEESEWSSSEEKDETEDEDSCSTKDNSSVLDEVEPARSKPQFSHVPKTKLMYKRAKFACGQKSHHHVETREETNKVHSKKRRCSLPDYQEDIDVRSLKKRSSSPVLVLSEEKTDLMKSNDHPTVPNKHSSSMIQEKPPSSRIDVKHRESRTTKASIVLRKTLPQMRHLRQKIDSNVGAEGPNGEFVPFPEYRGGYEPPMWKKPFVQFKRRQTDQLKDMMGGHETSAKDRPLKDTAKRAWKNLSETEKDIYRKWTEWDSKRYQRDMKLFKRWLLGMPLWDTFRMHFKREELRERWI